MLRAQPTIDGLGELAGLNEKLVRESLADLVTFIADHVSPPPTQVEIIDGLAGKRSKRDASSFERELMVPHARFDAISGCAHRDCREIERRAVCELEAPLGREACE